MASKVSQYSRQEPPEHHKVGKIKNIHKELKNKSIEKLTDQLMQKE